MASRGWGLVPKTILPTIIISAVIASAVGLVLYLDEKASVIARSRKTAIAIAQQTLAERQVYAANVVNPLLRDFGGPDQGFTTGNNTIHWVTSKMYNPKDKGALPLPEALLPGTAPGRSVHAAQRPSASAGTRAKPVKSAACLPWNPPVTGSRRSDPGTWGTVPCGPACHSSTSTFGTPRPSSSSTWPCTMMRSPSGSPLCWMVRS